MLTTRSGDVYTQLVLSIAWLCSHCTTGSCQICAVAGMCCQNASTALGFSLVLQSDLLLVDHCVAVRCDLIGWLQLHLRVVLVWTDIRYGLDHTQLKRLRAHSSFEHTAAFHASYDRLMTDSSGGEHVLPRCVECVAVLSCAAVRLAVAWLLWQSQCALTWLSGSS